MYSALSETGDQLSVSLSSECGGTELRCNRGSPAGGRAHQLSPGTYYFVLEGSASREVDFSFDVSFEDPTPPPLGDVCSNPVTVTPGRSDSARISFDGLAPTMVNEIDGLPALKRGMTSSQNQVTACWLGK